MLTRIRLPATIPSRLYGLWLVFCLILLSRNCFKAGFLQLYLIPQLEPNSLAAEFGVGFCLECEGQFLKPPKGSYTPLKTLYTFGNCQRPVFLIIGVSQHLHKITNMWKFGLNWSSKLWDNKGRKNTLVTRSCVLRCSKSNSEVSKSNSNIKVENYFFLENCVTSEGAASHNVLYYQQLSNACYQVSFFAHNYFE